MAALDAQLCLYLDAAVARQEWGRLHQCRRVTHAVVRVTADGGGGGGTRSPRGGATP